MVKWQVRWNAIDPRSSTPLEDYIESFGINKDFVEDFLHEPREMTRENPFHLENMNAGLDLVYEMINSGKPLTLVVDCDVDGFTSAAMFYNFFKPYTKGEIRWRLHKGKEHGVEKFMVDEDTAYVIIPDAGSNQKEELMELSNRGIKVLVLDHHEAEELLDIPNVVIINNQLSPRFINKSLSGAGVVLKFIEAYRSSHFSEEIDYKFYDLAATGIVSDMMDCRALDNNFIVWHGLNHIENKMLQALLKKQAFKINDIYHPTKIDIGFYIAPIINGTIRFGEQSEKEDLFRGFIEEPRETKITTTYRGETRVEDFYDYVARICANAKNRQDVEKKKCAAFLKQKIAEKGLDKNAIICITTDPTDEVKVPTTITGLVAMELLNTYNKPCLVLHPRKEENGEQVFAGSGRSKTFDGLASFREFVRDSNSTEYAQGHACAFGAAIKADELDKFIKEANERLKDLDFTNTAEVECEFYNSDININLLEKFASLPALYGNNIPQPHFAFYGKTATSNIKLMKNNSFCICLAGINGVRFKDEELCNNLPQSLLCNYKLIGRVQMNYFRGIAKPQLLIDEIELEPIQVSSLF